jgi:hypothetical protein
MENEKDNTSECFPSTFDYYETTTLYQNNRRRAGPCRVCCA